MNQLKAEHSFVKFLLKYCGGPARYKGELMTQGDRTVVRDAIRLWLAVMRDVCVVGGCSSEGRLRLLAKVIHSMDLYDLMITLDFVSDWLTRSVEDQSLRNYQRLKCAVAKECSDAEPIRCVLGLTKQHLLGWFRHRDVASFKAARQAYTFLTRLNLKECALLADTAFEQWWQPEKNFTPENDFSGDEQTIISEWFPFEDAALLYAGFSPTHGGGSTYEGVTSTGAKALLNGYDEKIRTVLLCLGWDPDFRGLMQKPWFLPCDGAQPCTPPSRHKVMFVPKNWKTYRTVSMEPVAYMFMQLGANNAIKRYLRNGHSRMARHYCVDTEDKNRELARLGSIDGSYSTIDISAASDSVSLELALTWFDMSSLGLFVRNLRTDFAEFDCETSEFWGRDRIRDLIRVGKFAPMGSGLCFSIESTVFCAMSESAVRCTPGVRRDYRVYGDDIVIDTAAAPTLMRILQERGFAPNKLKSFMNPPGNDVTDFFRESCGGEYLNGYDVTPKRISRKFSGFLAGLSKSDRNPSSISQLISLANDLYDLRTARSMIISDLLSCRLPVLFDGDGTLGIRSAKPSNYHLPHRWNIHLQRWEVRAIVLISKAKKLAYHEDSYLGEVRLFEYLRLAEASNREHLLYPEDMVGERMDPYQAELSARHKWVVCPEQPENSGQ